MRVVQLLASGSFAGAEAVACSLARALVPHVERSAIYLIQELRSGAASCAELAARAEGFGVPVRRFASRERFSARLAGELRRALAADGVDVAHSHSYKPAFYCPLLRRLGGRAPRAALFTIHGMDHRRLRGQLFERAVTGLGAYLGDAVIAVSRPLAEQLQRWPLLARRVHAIPNALSGGNSEPLATLRAARAARRAELATRFGADPTRPWLALVGRLVPVKNHALLLAALAALPAEQRPQVLLVGDGPLRAELAALAAELGVADRVCFTGHVDGLGTLYGAIDLLVLCSDSEGSPMVLLEAMSYGLPVLSTAVGGVPDIVHDGKTGLLCAAGDRNGLTAALRRLLADEVLRRRLGDAGHQRVRAEFGADAWARAHVALYRECIGGAPLTDGR